MLARPSSELSTISPATIELVTLSLSAAIVLGMAFGVFSLIGRIDERATLQRHSMVRRGQFAPDGVTRLEARGARGLKPVRSAEYGVKAQPVSGRR